MKKSRILSSVLVLICLITLTLFVSNRIFATNEIQGEMQSPEKSYMAITVQVNDTLWDIAENYMNTDYYDHESFINEVSSMNNIIDSKIFAGQTIVVPVIQEP